MGSDWQDFCDSQGVSVSYYNENDDAFQSYLKGNSSKQSKQSSGSGHTYEKWQELGYQVRRGERAAYKYYGKSIFTSDQVDEI